MIKIIQVKAPYIWGLFCFYKNQNLNSLSEITGLI